MNEDEFVIREFLLLYDLLQIDAYHTKLDLKDNYNGHFEGDAS